MGFEVLQKEKWERRRDLTGVVFRVTSETDPPYAVTAPANMRELPKGYTFTQKDKDAFIVLTGIYGDIWESLQHTTNFSYWMVNLC